MSRLTAPHAIDDARSILRYLIMDLLAGRHLYDMSIRATKRPQVSVMPENERAILRIYISHFVLTLYKVTEFLDYYGRLIPDQLKKPCTTIGRELKRRHVKNLRDTFIGHIHKKGTKRPLTGDELDAAFNTAIGGDLDRFIQWVHVPGKSDSPSSVVGVLQALHSALK